MDQDDERHAQAARNRALYAMRRPENFSPWEEAHPNGHKLVKAIYGLTTQDFRADARNLLADIDVGLLPEQWQARQDHLWRHLLWRLQHQQLVARGRQDGGDQQQDIPVDMLDDAKPDFEANSLTCAGVLFRSVRVFPATETAVAFAAKDVPATAGIARAEPRHGDEFIQEMLRFALTPDGFQSRKQLELHMKEWFTKKLGDDAPSERSIERWVKRYCPPQLSTK